MYIYFLFLVLLLYKSWIQTEELVDSQLENDREVRHGFAEGKNDLNIDTPILNSQELWYLKKKEKDENIIDVTGLEEAKERIRQLEAKLLSLDARIPKGFPDVKFLSYRAKKRILVSLN